MLSRFGAEFSIESLGFDLSCKPQCGHSGFSTFARLVLAVNAVSAVTTLHMFGLAKDRDLSAGVSLEA